MTETVPSSDVTWYRDRSLRKRSTLSFLLSGQSVLPVREGPENLEQ